MAIPAIVAGLLIKYAPTLLTALKLPRPFNRIAASVVSDTLGPFAGTTPTEQPMDGDGDAAPVRALTPDEVVDTVERNQADQQFRNALKQAEIDLKKYELEAGLTFAELELEDRKRAGSFQTENDMGKVVFNAGINLVRLAIISMIVLVIGLVLIASGFWELKSNAMTTAAFGLIGTAVGFINGIAGAVVTFYWGSSQGSKDKTEALEKQFQTFGAALNEANRSQPVPPTPAPAPSPTMLVQDRDGKLTVQSLDAAAERPHGQTSGGRPTVASIPGDAVTPASLSLTAELVPELSQPHRKFPDSVAWSLVEDGVSVESASAERTGGAPKTVTRIWDEYSEQCSLWAKSYGVPVELIVATIATESRGNPEAFREEPHINDRSMGLMQTLVRTAREALDRPGLTLNDLRDPSTSIQAGAAFIAQQRKVTHFDPPLVAAAYNAGSVYHEAAEANRWRLRCYPKNTGHHVDRFVSWFGDSMRVSAEMGWDADGTVPSYAAAIRRNAPSSGGGDDPEATLPAVVMPVAAGTALTLLRQFTGAPIPLVSLSGQAPRLVMAIQSRLGELGYLDPPADGDFGRVSTWALKTFCTQNQLDHRDSFESGIATALADPLNLQPEVPAQGNWLDKVVAYMVEQEYWICRSPGCRNIVYLEGVDETGHLNQNQPNHFNDLRLVFWMDDSGQFEHRTWAGSTEPSSRLTVSPVNPKGAARIKFGQYKAWRVGIHKKASSSSHEALVQVKPVSVCRDLNADFKRIGDSVDTGLFGINQHSGYDKPDHDMGRTGAGCLLGRTTVGHREFMDQIKQDPRYRANQNYTFMTAILPGREVLI